MKLTRRAVCFLLLSLVLGRAETNSISFATLNCFWYYEGYSGKILPRDGAAYSKKAENLISLMPTDAPLLLGVQELGGEKDAEELAKFASKRYGRAYKSLFVPGRDVKQRESVAALLDTTQGWGVSGKPGRDADLEKALPWHLIVRITNVYTRVDVCVARLLPPRVSTDVSKQIEQNRALVAWVRPLLKKDPAANIIIMGDFNERRPPASKVQTLSVLLEMGPPFFDPIALEADPFTHTAGVAMDRILISEGMRRGASWYRFTDLEILKHKYLTAGEQRLFTAHFPVVAKFAPVLGDPSTPD